jgi:hypothetical protein
MSILLLFGINFCMESNKINLKLLNLGQISRKWLLSSINIDLLLHGNRSFSYDLNTEIFQAVHKFIIDTHRFI